MNRHHKLDMNEVLPEFGMTRLELAEHLEPVLDDIRAGRTVTTEELREKYRRLREECLKSRPRSELPKLGFFEAHHDWR